MKKVMLTNHRTKTKNKTIYLCPLRVVKQGLKAGSFFLKISFVPEGFPESYLIHKLRLSFYEIIALKWSLQLKSTEPDWSDFKKPNIWGPCCLGSLADLKKCDLDQRGQKEDRMCWGRMYCDRRRGWSKVEVHKCCQDTLRGPVAIQDHGKYKKW